MAISNEDAINAVPNCDSFIRDYFLYAIEQGNEPAYIFHLGVGLSMLAATAPVDMQVRYASYIMRPNLYTLIVGPSGDGKSVAISRGTELLYKGAPKLVGKVPGSSEGLFDALAIQPQQIIPFSEWGAFLAPARSGYFQSIKTRITDLYDCNPQSRGKAKNKDNATYIDSIPNPRLSVVAGCSLSYLESYTLLEDWTGGFMGRFLIMYGNMGDPDPWPVANLTFQPKLIQALSERAQFKGPVGECLGPAPGECMDLWKEWYTDLHYRPISSQIAGVKRRVPAVALKAAMLYHWDFGEVGTKDWYIDKNVLKYAIALAELHLKSVLDLTQTIAVNDDARMIREVVSAVEGFGGEATYQQICGRVKRRHRLVTELIETCVRQGHLRMMATPDGDIYKLIK